MKEAGKKGFTLVELIVVITILAILGVIAFISFQNYTTYARDVVRLSDLNNMKSVLEYTNTETGYYPDPDNGTDIKYEGTIVWKQGSFGTTVKRATKRLDKVPKDPLTSTEYTYSVSANGREYELAGAYEGDEIVGTRNLVEQTHANTEGLKTRLIGNYNGKVKVIQHNSTDYVLALPSLVAIDTSDTTDDNLENIINNKLLTYNGYNSLPHTYGNNTPPTEGSFEFIPKKLVAWSGSLEEIKKTGSGFTQLSTGLYSAYLGTNLYLKGDEYKYIDGKDVVKYILNSAPEEGNLYRSCKEIKVGTQATQTGCYGLKGNFIASGIGCLDDTSSPRYYCEMGKDGGGWTLYVKIKGNYSFEDAKSCVLGTDINNSELYCRVPFVFGKNEELWYQDLTTGSGYVSDITGVFKEKYSIRGSFYKTQYFDFMYHTGTSGEYPSDLPLDRVSYIRLGINYQHIHPESGYGRNPGGFYAGAKWYMSYSSGHASAYPSGPAPGNREVDARQGEFYVR